MTLQEVFNQIPEAARTKRVPSVLMLVKEGLPVLKAKMDEETSATIYSNGFVIYRSGERATVFPLHDCRDYVYYTVKERSTIPFSEFADQPWQVRVFMEGKDRLVHNQNNRKGSRTVSIDAYEGDVAWLELSDHGSFDPLRMLIEAETKRDEYELLYHSMAKLTERQREILILCVVNGKTHTEAAKMLGMTHQAVTDSLKKSLTRLRRMYGVDENVGGRNCFCRYGK